MWANVTNFLHLEPIYDLAAPKTQDDLIRLRVMGIVVDAVSDVYSLAEEEMKAAPDLGDHVNTLYIKGLVNVNNKMVILLDINELLGADTIPDVSINTIKEIKEAQ